MIITLIVISGMLVVLIFSWIEADIAMLLTLIILLLFGILTPQEAFSGFSSDSVIIIAALFIVVKALQQKRVMTKAMGLIFGRTATYKRSLGRMMMGTAFLSAFINNTPIVSFFTPIVKEWAEKHRISPSKLLIPLSYAAVLGGMCTLIGTSTNLVINGLLIKAGEKGFSFFELALVGVPCTIVAVIYLCTIGHKILPERSPQTSPLIWQGSEEWVVGFIVSRDSEMVGKTIKEVGLRQLEGTFLVAIFRSGSCLCPVSTEDRLEAGDRCLFSGIIDRIDDLKKIKGLKESNEPEFNMAMLEGSNVSLYQGTVPGSSSLTKRPIKSLQFRSKYQASILAVYRNGKRIQRKTGDIQLKSGDMIYFLADKNSLMNQKLNRTMVITNHVKTVEDKGIALSLGTLAVMILFVSFGLLSMVTASLAAVSIIILFRCVTAKEARQSIDWSILILIGSAIGLAQALENSGAADFIATGITQLSSGFGPTITLATIFIVTNIITSFVSNNAAAAMMFPIAVSLAGHLSIQIEPLAIVIAMAASAGFASPIGYQTHWLVYGPGEYRFIDFIKVGMPLNFIIMIVVITIVPIFWPM